MEPPSARPHLRPHFVVIASLFTLLFSIPPQAFPTAQAEDFLKMTVSPGLDGYCKDQSWIPVFITLENQGPDLEGFVSVTAPGPGGGQVGYAQSVSLPQQGRKIVQLSVYPQGFLTDLEAVLETDSQVVARTPFQVTCVSDGDALFGIVSDAPSGFNRLLDADPPSGSAFVAQLQLAELPVYFQDLQPLNMLVISDADTSSLTSRQLSVLTGWVASGGHLLVTGGPDWQKTTAGLADLLPLQPTHTLTLPGLAPLATLVGDSTALNSDTTITSGIPRPGSRVLASADGEPLLLQHPLGSGLVTFLAASPSLSPLDRWEAFPALILNLLTEQGIPSTDGWPNGFQSWPEANAALSIIPGLAFPSIVLICGFLFLYTFAVGPANYLILRRWGRKDFAWVSIPSLVIFFSGVAYLVGGQTRGASVILNRLAIVQAWPGAGVGRADTLLGVFSPTRTTFDLVLDGELRAHPVPADFGSPFRDWQLIQNDSNLIIKDIQLDTGGLASFAASGFVPAPEVSHSLEYQLDPLTQTLSGEIRIEAGPSLEDAVVLAPGGVHRLGEIRPGETHQVDIDLTASVASASGAQIGYGFGGNLSLIEEIIGAPYFSSYDDEQSRVRIDLLSAWLDPSRPTRSRPADVFLAGWSKAALPFMAAVPGLETASRDLTLYIIALQVPIPAGQQITIPPGQFTWQPYPAAAGPIDRPPLSPYDMFILPGTVFDLQFQLNSPLVVEKITRATMRLESDQGGIVPPQISIWNRSSETWQRQLDRGWGVHELENPENYFGTRGEILVRIELPQDQTGVFLKALDFSLVVNTEEY